MEKPILQVDLSGEDGNIFQLLALAGRALAQKSRSDDMTGRVLQSHSYEEALSIINMYVTVMDSRKHGNP